ncbi:cobalamin-dependent protein, partial [Candidatus Sumerlaeota bacterium]|nr:cobalamin-dependent protein [Candidatus Sumerlaeota bacterium]
MRRRLRFVLATPICDGHDVAVVAVTRLLRSQGVEAVYLGFNKGARQIVKAAVEEDAAAIALSSYNGGHMSFLREVMKEKKKQGIPEVPVFCGGGGTILAKEAGRLERMGVTKLYRPPLDLAEAIGDMIRRTEAHWRKSGAAARGARQGSAAAPNGYLNLARRLSEIENGGRRRGKRRTGRRRGASSPARADASSLWRTVGVGGRGGAGKSTIVDELVLRFLRSCRGSIAIVALDPTLGDRLRMLYCYSPRVFFRSVM